jgi:hypothetical protein
MTDKCELCNGTKVDTVFGGRCEWCDETGKAGGLTPLPAGRLAMLPAMLDAVNHGVGVMLVSAKGAEHVPHSDFFKDCPEPTKEEAAFRAYLAADPMATYWSTWQERARSEQSELAALREELAKAHKDRGTLLKLHVHLRARRSYWIAEETKARRDLVAAEQRNVRLIRLLKHFASLADVRQVGTLAMDAAAELSKPTESGASE